MTYLPADVLHAVAAKAMASIGKQIQDEAMTHPFGPEREQILTDGNAWWVSFWRTNLPALYDAVAAEIPEHPRDSEAYKVARIFGEAYAKDTRLAMRQAIPAERAYKLADSVISRDYATLKEASWSAEHTQIMRTVLVRLGVPAPTTAKESEWTRALMVWCNIDPVEHERARREREAAEAAEAKAEKAARDAERFAELYPGLLGQAVREGAVSKLHAAKLTSKTYRYRELDDAILTEPAAIERFIVEGRRPYFRKDVYMSGPRGGSTGDVHGLIHPTTSSIAILTATGYDFARWLWNREHPDDIIPPRPKAEPKPKKRDDWRW